MLHIATVHLISPRWIPIQTRALHEHIADPHEIWSSLELIDARWDKYFDHVVAQRGSHAGKLNHLAFEISQIADPADLIMFIDGDAFPIADPMPLVREGLSATSLVAVRRAENAGEPQPHPCFCVTTIETWNRISGDWTDGPTWEGPHGEPESDVGANLLHRLSHAGLTWSEILRSNKHNIHPLYYAIYGNAIYHHGAGFRPMGPLTRAQRDQAPRQLLASDTPVLRTISHRINRERRRWWDIRTSRANRRQSEAVFRHIEQRGEQWIRETFLPSAATADSS